MIKPHAYKAVGETRYKELVTTRSLYLDMAKECCRYTLPSLLSFFEEKMNNSKIDQPYQGIGARGVSNLASKLLQALTPTNEPMFRLVIDNSILKTQRESVDENWLTEIQSGLTGYAEAVSNAIKASGDYAHMYEVWQLLLVSGNVLIVDPEDNSNIRVYSLRDYVLKRDRKGNCTEICIKETLSKRVIPEKILSQIEAQILDLPSSEGLASDKGNDKEYDLYTYVVRENNFYYSHQECKGHVIEGSEGKYPLHGCPFIPIRMYAGAGEDYSRSYVSNYLGDLKSIDGLSQAVVEGADMSARFVCFVNPAGTTDINDVTNSANGDVVYGNAGDISFMQSNKSFDLRMVGEQIDKLEKRISQAFLLIDGGIRNAERVTKEEIRVIAGELEEGLGGIYSVMCYSFQIPYIKRKIFKLQTMGLITSLNKSISPVVVTGFEALGMNGDKERLVEYIGTIEQTLGNEGLRYINPEIYVKQLATSMSIETSGLIKSKETIKEETQAAQAQAAGQALISKGLPAALNNAEGLSNVISGNVPQGEQ